MGVKNYMLTLVRVNLLNKSELIWISQRVLGEDKNIIL